MTISYNAGDVFNYKSKNTKHVGIVFEAKKGDIESIIELENITPNYTTGFFTEKDINRMSEEEKFNIEDTQQKPYTRIKPATISDLIKYLHNAAELKEEIAKTHHTHDGIIAARLQDYAEGFISNLKLGMTPCDALSEPPEPTGTATYIITGIYNGVADELNSSEIKFPNKEDVKGLTEGDIAILFSKKFPKGGTRLPARLTEHGYNKGESTEYSHFKNGLGAEGLGAVRAYEVPERMLDYVEDALPLKIIEDKGEKKIQYFA